MLHLLGSNEDIEVKLVPYGKEGEDTATAAVVALDNATKVATQAENETIADACTLTETIVQAIEAKGEDSYCPVACEIALEVLAHFSRRFDIRVPTPSVENLKSPVSRKMATSLLKRSLLAMRQSLKQKLAPF